MLRAIAAKSHQDRAPFMSPRGLRLALEVAVPLERRRFVYDYDELGLLHQPASLAGQLFLASEVVF